mgnify:CR=1 FL=1
MLELSDPFVAGTLANVAGHFVCEYLPQAISFLKRVIRTIPAECLTEIPPKDIIARILFESQYYTDESEVRKILEKLLRASLHKETSSSVRCAFVEIAKQLSPIDAKILINLGNPTSLLHCPRNTNSLMDNAPLMDIYISEKYPEYEREVSISIGNLTRLGLLYIPTRNMGSVTIEGNDNGLIEKFRNTNFFKTNYPHEDISKLNIKTYKAYLTELGLYFRQLAFSDV